MPAQDGTGPRGLGPLTGRGFGSCGRGMQRRCGMGFGRGLGFGRRTLTESKEKEILEEELKEIELEKQEIAKRLKELK